MILTFWKGVYLSKWYNLKRDTLLKLGEDLIIKGLEEGRALNIQIAVYTKFLDTIKDRKINKQPIRRSDLQFGLYCMIALIKLKVIEEEDDPLNGLYYSPIIRKHS